jgi:hypothetical protein
VVSGLRFKVSGLRFKVSGWANSTAKKSGIKDDPDTAADIFPKSRFDLKILP